MRKSSAKHQNNNHGNDNGEPAFHLVRYDYSATHLDNEELEQQLVDDANELFLARHRLLSERDKMLLTAKQNADEMLKLKLKVKNRALNESSDKVRLSADSKSNQLLKQKSAVASSNSQEPLPEVHDGLNNRPIIHGSREKNMNFQPMTAKPINNLTMFLLSIQRLKRPEMHLTRHETTDDKRDKKKTLEPNVHRKLQKRPQTSAGLMKRPKSHQYGERFKEDADEESVPKTQYGIHVRKDFTRSRRELEEISRLEQDSKYSNVNKYEERRKRLLAKCKDTELLQERIKYFLKEVDSFKLMCSEDNSEDKVLLRTKTAFAPRTDTFVW